MISSNLSRDIYVFLAAFAMQMMILWSYLTWKAYRVFDKD